MGCSPWGREESDTTEQLHFDFSLSCIRGEMATHSSVLAWRIPIILDMFIHYIYSSSQYHIVKNNFSFPSLVTKETLTGTCTLLLILLNNKNYKQQKLERKRETVKEGEGKEREREKRNLVDD